MGIARSLRALLEHSIDYAGMFPPCSLNLDPAVGNQAQYTRSNENWMLAAFVLPVDKFEDVRSLLTNFEKSRPFRVSVLGPKTADATGFARTINQIAASIRSFAGHEAVSIEQLEIYLPEQVQLDGLIEARSILGNLPAFFEAPIDRAEQTIGWIREVNETSKAVSGFKLRTGGVTADAFPTSDQIAGVLVTAAREQAPIKFTAGLHHPIRQFRDEVNAKMYGFLNVLGAAILCSRHNWDEKETMAMLDDEDPKSFSFNDDVFSWREWSAEVRSIKDQRKRVCSFGSCSFDEPREDLRALGLL